MNIQDYIDLGWSAFPVKGPYYGKFYEDTKKPLPATWKPYQSRKPTNEEVMGWNALYSKMSIAAVTGPISGFIVVDIDSDDWIKAFPNADFGITWKSMSTRGCHYFYKWEDWMLGIASTGSKIGEVEGFDIRGMGGYVVVPNDNDPARTWAVHPTAEELAPMPEWIKSFLLRSVNSSGKKTLPPIAEISEGNRHDAFLSYIGKFRKAGISDGEVMQILNPIAEKIGYQSELVELMADVIQRYPNADLRDELRPESMEALLLEPEPPLEWMIEGLWTHHAKGFIAGHPGTGKTWIALDMMLSVATGGLCMGKYKPAYTAPCLIVEEEASRRNLQRRIHCMARARQLAPSALANVFHITQQFTNIPRDTQQIISIIQKHGIKFVVFDSLREVHTSKENSSDDMSMVLKAFKEISVVGNCAVLLIHHLSKTNGEKGAVSIFERMRGTGSLWAWRDCILGIEGEEESTVAKCSFQFRDAESPAPVKITRHVGKLSGAVGLEAVCLEESEEFEEKSIAILDVVKSQFGGASRNTICKALDGRKQDNLKVLKRMEKLGLLAVSGLKLVVPDSPEPPGTTGT